jgi:hypothetical protein
MDALSQAAAEITSELPAGSVDVRLRGREPQFVVDVPTMPLAPTPPMPPAPPAPPSPPEGPPFGTNFSRRNATHPFPPLPAFRWIVASSMNILKVDG